MSDPHGNTMVDVIIRGYGTIEMSDGTWHWLVEALGQIWTCPHRSIRYGYWHGEKQVQRSHLTRYTKGTACH